MSELESGHNAILQLVESPQDQKRDPGNWESKGRSSCIEQIVLKMV